jgi:hypothetical protein
MVDREKFTRFIETIVAQVLHDEKDIFRLEGGQLIGDLYEGKDIRSDTDSRVGAFGFAEEAKVVLEMISLILGTFQSIDWLITRFRGALENETVVHQWQVKLQEAGLPSDLSEKIVRQFHPAFVELVRDQEPANRTPNPL